MAGTFQVNNDALEECRSTVSSQKSRFGGIADGFDRQYTSSTAFGKLANSAKLATLVEEIDTAAHQELTKAETLLGSVETSIDKVRTSVEATEADNKTLLGG